MDDEAGRALWSITATGRYSTEGGASASMALRSRSVTTRHMSELSTLSVTSMSLGKSGSM
jgi:hypothetical protein